jgi:hypothetical protein
MVALSALSVNAQDTGQEAICAPWSQEWDISQGWWYFQWYRWCYDPLTSDPSVEENWYREWGVWEWVLPGRVGYAILTHQSATHYATLVQHHRRTHG